jgi:hypothetical protein
LILASLAIAVKLLIDNYWLVLQVSSAGQPLRGLAGFRPLASVFSLFGQRKGTKRKPTHLNRPTGNLSITKSNGRSGTPKKWCSIIFYSNTLRCKHRLIWWFSGDLKMGQKIKIKIKIKIKNDWADLTMSDQWFWPTSPFFRRLSFATNNGVYREGYLSIKWWSII